MINIAVVNSSSLGKVFPQHWKVLTRLGKVKRFDVPVTIPGQKLGRLLKGFHAIIAGVNPDYPPEFFRETKGTLKLIARHGIGTNNVDIKAASQVGVIVTKVPGEDEQEAMAEHTLALMLAILRKLENAQSAVRRGRWLDRPAFVGLEIKGKTLGLIGLGNIGRRVGEIAKKGFGAHVVAFDPRLKLSAIRQRGAEPVDFKQLLKRADIISLHCSLSSRNYHFINQTVIRQMKPGVILINTARGELVEQRALIGALKSGHLRGYACDVVEGEPITDRRHPLLRLENAIVVPHIGAYTKESLWAMGEKVVQDVKDVVRGKKPKGIVKPSA